MLKKIAIAQVRIGMFVESVEGPWLKHSLWKSRFLIENSETLARVRDCGASECWIDVSRGADAVVAQSASARAPGVSRVAEQRKPMRRRSMADELQNAAHVINRSKATMTALFEEARMGRAIEAAACAPLVNDIVESIDRNATALISLSRLKSADEYTYMHSVSVCALMVALGRQLGLDDAACRDAGLAGLLHDLGKAKMPPEIINKPGKLSDDEFSVIKSHPVRGHEMLLESGVDNERVLDVCRHHHERVDGQGYPDKLTADELSLIARMSAVCDVYDAVTSNRPYKAGWDPADAIAQMASWKGHFDQKVLQTFIKAIGIYPTGSLVRMSSGKLAVVVEQNPRKLTAPKVKVFFSTNSGLPLTPKLIDLSESHVREKIVAREPPENWSFGYLNDLWAASI